MAGEAGVDAAGVAGEEVDGRCSMAARPVVADLLLDVTAAVAVVEDELSPFTIASPLLAVIICRV